VLVHEWNDPKLVAQLGELRARRRDFRLLFHDTHHRAATAPEQMRAFDLRDYDGVLAFGAVIRDIYLEQGWTQQAWVWHEAADVNRFRPILIEAPEADVIWIGNWGDEERSLELRQYLFDPVHELELTARVHGVRYPKEALAMLDARGIYYGAGSPTIRCPRPSHATA
jgi:spore maturation protein CgeB